MEINETKKSLKYFFSLLYFCIAFIILAVLYYQYIDNSILYNDNIALKLINNTKNLQLRKNINLLLVLDKENQKELKAKATNKKIIKKYLNNNNNAVDIKWNNLYYLASKPDFKKVIYIETNIFTTQEIFKYLLILLLLFAIFYILYRKSSKKIYDNINNIAFIITKDINQIIENQNSFTDIKHNYKNNFYDLINLVYVNNVNLKNKIIQQEDYNKKRSQETQEEIVLLENKITRLSTEKAKIIKSQKSKEIFLAVMSHEIRTPLNGIIGMLEILLNTSLNKTQQENATIARNSAKKLIKIIEDILSFSSIEAGKNNINYSPIDLHKIVNEVCFLLVEKAITNKTDIIINIDPDIQDNIIGDSGKIRQVLLNLIGNAVKFTICGKVIINLEVASIKKDKIKIKFLVEDSGIGIDNSKQDILFDPYVQVDKNNKEGSGLGLYITKKLIEVMGGEIKINSELNQGSKFYFTLEFSFISKNNNFFLQFYNKLKNKKILIYTNKKYCIDIINSCLTGVDVQLDYTDNLVNFKEKFVANKTNDFIIIDIDITDNETNFIPIIDNLLEHDNNSKIIYTSYKPLNKFNEYENIVFLQKPFSKIRLLESLTLKTNNILIDKKEKPNNNTKYDKIKCLIVEDNLINQKVISQMLKQIGTTNIKIANNANYALKFFKAETFDIVFMDCQLPDIDGYSTSEKIREYELANNIKKTTIIALTAFTSEEAKQKCFNAGMDEYLQKPILLDQLTIVLNKVINDNNDLFDTSSLPLIDANRLSEIKNLMGNNFEDFITLYEKNTVTILTKIRLAIDSSDQKLLVISAHTLKSSSANIGAKKIVFLCNKLENINLANNKDRIKKLVSLLEKNINLTAIELKH